MQSRHSKNYIQHVLKPERRKAANYSNLCYTHTREVKPNTSFAVMSNLQTHYFYTVNVQKYFWSRSLAVQLIFLAVKKVSRCPQWCSSNLYSAPAQNFVITWKLPNGNSISSFVINYSYPKPQSLDSRSCFKANKNLILQSQAQKNLQKQKKVLWIRLCLIR